MVTWNDFEKIWASTSPLTPYEFSDSNYSQGWNFVGSTPPARQMWDSIQKKNDEKFKYLRDNFGTPNIVTTASQMTDTGKVYVYMGSEAGWSNGHWYYWNGTTWADGGVYNSVAFVTDTTLSIAGQPADAKATGDALALKSDLAGCTFTGNVGINADLSVTGDASIGTDLSVAGTSTLTGNVSASGDIVVVGDVSSANLTTSADATIGGDLSVTGASTLAGNITTSGDISADNISATTNGTVGGNLSVTGTSTLTGNINAGADISAVGDVSADNLTTTTNATVGGSLSVAGTSTLTGNVTTNGNINAVGDISSANLTTTNATIGGNATVTGDVSCANLTTSTDASVGGDLTVTGDSTLADTTVNDLVVNNDLSVAGDSSLTNLFVSGTTALNGNSTAITQPIDDNSTKIATTEYVQAEIKPIEADVSVNDKRISNIEKLLQGNLYDYQTDDTSAYTKTVPSGAMSYAGIEKLGGKTVVMNQVCSTTIASNTTGLTVTRNDDGSYILNGTSVAGWLNFTITSVYSGHKYIVFGCPSGYSAYMGIGGTNLDSGSGGIWTSNTTNASTLRFHTRADVVFDNVKLYTNAIDMTLMFGAGNEPTTVEQFREMFPAEYYPYNAGTLLSAGVSEVVSKGKNLADYSGGRGYPSDTSLVQTTKRTFDVGKYVLGLTFSNYYNESQVTCTFNNGVGTLVGGANANYGFGVPFVCKATATYTLSATISGSAWKLSFAWYKKDGTYLGNSNTDNVQSKTVTAPANAEVGVAIISTSVNTTITFKNVQVEASATATDYSAPFTNEYPIPSEIQALDGYGWSAGTAYNYIDYERKVFVKRVGAVTLDGTEGWGNAGGNAPYRYDPNNGKNYTTNETPNILTVDYTAIPWNTSFTDYDKMVAYFSGSWRFRDTSCADLSAWTTKLSANPLTVYYELATPIEVDISAYITDDNLIEVESGGSLTFPNSNGTDYQIPVPSEETYMINLQEAVSNG